MARAHDEAPPPASAAGPRSFGIALLVLALVFVSAEARAQSIGAWSLRASAVTYFLPRDDNYVQPTVALDRGALHLEGRYNYEALRSASAFVGWNFEFGDTVTLQLTPMVGAVAGDTDGVIPGLELDLVWNRLELYSEGEYVIDVRDPSSRFLYNWSELSVWTTEWLRAGLVGQRTRAHQTPLDIQRGLLLGVTVSRVEPVLYYFNPGSHDYFIVAAISVEL